MSFHAFAVYSDEFIAISVPLPPHSEQDQIVRFLDWKVSKINKLINAKKRQIELFKEQKRVVVNKVISKRGDNWKTAKFKRFTLGANTGVSIAKEHWTENGKILLYTAGQHPIKTEYPNFPQEWYTTDRDILVARNGAGSIHMPIIGSAYTDHVIRFILTSAMSKEYIYYSIVIGMTKVVAEANTVSLATLNKSDWDNIDIWYPTLEEQQNIVAYLDEKCSNINKIIEKLNREIKLFSEYRTRLISDVVTGNIDVRGVVVPEFKAVEEIEEQINMNEEKEEDA